MLAGLRSRWTMPCTWAASSASAICRGDGQRLVERQRPLRDPIGERRPLDQLQHQRRGAARLLEAVDRRDVRVVERRQHLGLALEARQAIGVEHERVGQDLQRDVALQRRVAAPVHLAHAAGADHRQDVVGAEAAAGREGHPAIIESAHEPTTLPRHLGARRRRPAHDPARVCSSAGAAARRPTGGGDRQRSIRAARGDDRPPAGGDAIGPADRTPDHRALPGADRGVEPARTRAAGHHRDQPRRAGHRRRARRGAQGRQGARTAARHPDRAEGQPRHPRSDDDDCRVAGARGLDPAAGLVRGAEAARGRRHPARQGQHERVGLLARDEGHQRLERPRRPVPQPLRARPQSLRFQLRVRAPPSRPTWWR